MGDTPVLPHFIDPGRQRLIIAGQKESCVSHSLLRIAALLAVGMLPSLVGCSSTQRPDASAVRQSIPQPILSTLPTEVRLHPFTGTRSFDNDGQITGAEVYLVAINQLGDPTNAFGDFRFELYSFRQQSPDPKKQLLDTWSLPLSDIQANVVHWDHIKRMYVFRLQWTKPLPVGQRFVLVTTFESPYTPRLTDEHVFVAGQ